MVNSARAAGLMLGLFGLSLGCTESAPRKLEVFTVDVRLESQDPSLDLSGLPVSLDDSGRFSTNAQGRMLLTYQQFAGAHLKLKVKLPDHLQADAPLEREYVLKVDDNGRTEPVEFVLWVSKAENKPTGDKVDFVIAVDGECEGRVVRFEGKAVGVTGPDGFLEHVVTRYPGKEVELIAEAKDGCPALRCRYLLSEDDTILRVDSSCETLTPAKAPEPPPMVAEAPKSPAPKPEPRRVTVASRAMPAEPKPRRQPPKSRTAPEKVAKARAPVAERSPAPAPKPEPKPAAAAKPEPKPEAAKPEAKPAIAQNPEPEAPDPVPSKADSTEVAARETPAPNPEAPDPEVKAEPKAPKAGHVALQVHCEPEGLLLHVDGKKTGEICRSGLMLELKPGVHKLSTSGPSCPESKASFIELSPAARSTAIHLKNACTLSCEDRVRQKLRERQRPTGVELACLRLEPSAKGYVDAQLLLSYAYMQGRDLPEATKLLRATLKTPAGKTQPEVLLRLATLESKQNQLDSAISHAEEAWRYRMKFTGGPQVRATSVMQLLKLRAGLQEQRFYADEDESAYNRALDLYGQLAATASKNGHGSRAQAAQTAMTRLKKQKRRIDGG